MVKDSTGIIQLALTATDNPIGIESQRRYFVNFPYFKMFARNKILVFAIYNKMFFVEIIIFDFYKTDDRKIEDTFF